MISVLSLNVFFDSTIVGVRACSDESVLQCDISCGVRAIPKASLPTLTGGAV